jgi:hypothetical protein
VIIVHTSKIPVVVVAGALLLTVGRSAAADNTPLDKGYRQMYNLQFEEAHRTFGEWERLHPDDPLGPISDAAAYLFSEFDRLKILQSEFFVENESFFGIRKLTPDPAVKRNFEDALNRGKQIADRVLQHSPDDANAQFATILRVGLHSDYLALIEKRYMQSLSEMKASRTMAEKLVARDPSYYDAYLAIGVENYLLSLKAAPIRWLLRAGGAETDKQAGIQRLRLTAEKGRYLLPFARLLLAVDAMRNKDRPRARQTLEWLAGEFPRNQLYRDELAKLK